MLVTGYTSRIMLNPFPIQFLALLAYFILRVGVGAMLIYFGATHARNSRALSKKLTLPLFPYGMVSAIVFSGTEIILGIMFILGFYTQIAALLTMGMSLKLLFLHKRFSSPLLESRSFYLLLFFVSLSLFITGAGAFAFDLPI